MLTMEEKEDENDLKEEKWDMTLSVGLIEEVEEEDDLKEEDDKDITYNTDSGGEGGDELNLKKDLTET